jgi:hypothetical protein
MDQTQTNTLYAIAGVILLAVIIAIIVQVKSRKNMQMAWTQPTRTETANIEEIVAFSGGGVVCLILLILHQIGIMLAFATTSEGIQQAAVGTLWIGGNTLWGIGIIVGRTRTYRVTQQESLGPPIVEGPSVFNA